MSVVASISIDDMPCTYHESQRIAIVGAGPSGLVASRYLKAQGFTPVLIEAHDDLGGQWNVGNPMSGVWPQMRTNTARMVTRFSDMDYLDRVALFPRNSEVRDYLQRYAASFGLLAEARFGTRVERLEKDGEGYRLKLRCGRNVTEENFLRVVIASGRYNFPDIPAIDGLSGFAGDCGVVHAFHYKDPERYRGKRVLVAGGNISSLEIASDVAMLGAASVSTAMRRQRYVMPKQIAGTPVESYGATRADALRRERSMPDEIAEDMLAFVLQYGGDPARYGAPAPERDIRRAGITNSQAFLHLVAEGRVDCRPWIASIDGRSVHFVDGSESNFDGIVFGTGYQLNLLYLSEKMQKTLEVSPQGLTLSEHTFHPDLPGLGVIGLYAQIGPYLPTIEQQARYLAYSWGGAITAPDAESQHRGLERCRATASQDLYQHLLSICFGRLAGVDPEHGVSTELAEILAETAVTAITFRLTGPESLPGAEAIVIAEARRYGRPQLFV